MIVASFGHYSAISGHDHDSCPKCLNLKFRHNLSYRASDRGAGESMAGIDARAMSHTANAASIATPDVLNWPDGWGIYPRCLFCAGCHNHAVAPDAGGVNVSDGAGGTEGWAGPASPGGYGIPGHRELGGC